MELVRSSFRETRSMSRRKSFHLCCVLCALLSGLVALALSLSWSTSAAASDVPAVHGPRYRKVPVNHPDRTGKFYLGREIAPVMGFGGIDWLERPIRNDEENLTALVESLNLKPGMVVADIGAGSGVISVMMAEKVKPEGEVIAVDIQQEMLDALSRKLNRLNVTNVRLVKGAEKTPNLKPESIDLAIMVDVYHEFAFPYEMMLGISKAMKPGGRVVFVEYRKEDPDVPIKPLHKMSQAQVKKEIGQPEFELKWKETIDVLPRQHIIVFERAPRNEQ